jgi:hypothetical protein
MSLDADQEWRSNDGTADATCGHAERVLYESEPRCKERRRSKRSARAAPERRQKKGAAGSGWSGRDGRCRTGAGEDLASATASSSPATRDACRRQDAAAERGRSSARGCSRTGGRPSGRSTRRTREGGEVGSGRKPGGAQRGRLPPSGKRWNRRRSWARRAEGSTPPRPLGRRRAMCRACFEPGIGRVRQERWKPHRE